MDDNHQVFALGYDVIVAITQQAINGQLLLLSDPDVGSINTNVVVAFEPPSEGEQSAGDYIPHFYQDLAAVPKITTPDGRSVPRWATLRGRFTPTFSITPNNPANDDGRPQKVVLQMNWTSGTLYAADQVHSWDITGWTWQAAVDLKIAIITKDDLVNGLAVPAAVFAALQKLVVDAGTAVLCLVLDFVAGGEWTCRTGANTDPAASVANHDAMLPYFYYLVKNPQANPYFLAYNVAGAGVAPSLTPVGCTFSLFHDDQVPDHSTINFIFSTQTSPTGGYNPVPGINKYPGRFARNRIAPTDQCDGKVIYSSRSFFAQMFIRPLKELFGGGDLDPPYTLYYHSHGLNKEAAYAGLNGTTELWTSGSAWFQGVVNTDSWSWRSTSSLSTGINADGDPVVIVGEPMMTYEKTPSGFAVGDVQRTLNGFTASPPPTFAQHQILLPFGNYFFAKDMGFLPNGDFSTQVTMKSPTGLQFGAAAAAPDVQVIENNIGKVIAYKPAAAAVSSTAANVTSGPKKARLSDDVKAMGAPMHDLVSLDLLQGPTSKVDITVSCELMHNAKFAMPLSGGHDMIAAQDATGHPLLCSIGDNTLNMLVANSGETNSGWTTTDLLQSFRDYSSVSLFDLVQEVDGTWSLAFVAHNQDLVGGTVFFASLLSNDLGKTNLEELSGYAFALEGIDAGFTAESIRVGSSVGGARPLLTVEGSISGKHLLYQLGPEHGTQAQRLELPEDMTPGAHNLLDHCTGVEFGYSANYFLYMVGQAQRLIAIAQNPSSADTPGSLSWDYSPAIKGGTCHCIATCPVPDTPRFSDLYFAGTAGVFRVADGQISLKERVADPKIVGEVTEIFIAHDGSQVAVWTINAKRDLYYTRGIRSPGSKTIDWGMPFLFSRDVTRVAPTRSSLRQTNELFCLNSSAVLHHYWQDPTSTMWRKRTGNEQGTTTIVNYDSYTTHIHFQQDDIPVSKGMTLSVTSSEWQYVTINNIVYSIHDKTPVIVTPDAMGNLTIISDAVDTASPVIHVASPQFAETLNVYPNGKVHKHLAIVTDGNSLGTAKDQAGNPVLPSGIDTSVSDGVANRVQAVHNVGDQDYPPIAAGNTFLVVEHPSKPSERGLKHTLMSPIRLSRPVGGSCTSSEPLLALTFADGKWRTMTPNELYLHTIAASSPTSLGGWFDWIGDAWHAIESAADYLVSKIEDAVVYVGEGIQFVLNKVEQGLELAIDYMGKAMKFILNTYIQVFKAISALLKLIGIDISAILRWLGHLFGWDTVWDTHKLIASTMKNFLHFGVASADKYLGKARQEAKGAFANLDQRLKNLESSNVPALLRDPTPLAPPPPKLSNSPQANFAFYHFSGAFTGNVATRSSAEVRESEIKVQDSNDFGNLFQQIIMPIANDVIPKLGHDIDELLKVFNTGSVRDVINFFVDLLITFLDGIEDAIDALLVTFGQAIGQLEEPLNDDFGLPILGALYKFVTLLMGDEEDFTVINGISFITAVAVVAALDVYGETQLPRRDNMDCTNPDFPSRLERLISKSVGVGHGVEDVGPRHPGQSLKQDSPDPTDVGQDWSYISGVLLNISSVISAIANGIPGGGTSADQAAFATSIASTVFGFPVPAGTGQPLDTWIQRMISWAVSSIVNVLTSIPSGKIAKVDGMFEGHPSKSAKQVQGAVSLVMGILVIGLAIEIDVREGTDALTWMSDTCGNLGVIAMAVGDVGEQPEVKVAAMGLTLFGTTFAFGDLIAAEGNRQVFKRILAPM